MLLRRKMDADLMCPACLDPYLQKRELTVDAVNLIDHLPVRDGFTAIATTGGHTVAPDQITADWSVDCSFGLLHRAMYERNVSLLDFPQGKLRRQFAVRFVRLGNNQQSAGFFVQTVNDSRAQLTTEL